MEPGFNCSELCDGSSSFSSQEQQRQALQELCTVTVVRTEAGERSGTRCLLHRSGLEWGDGEGGTEAQLPSYPGAARGCARSPPGMASKTSPA